MNKDFPIDIVIPWVDGNESKLKEKMKLYVENKELFESKKFRTRFDQVEEIKFSIDSILKFAPYIGNVFLVTDDQVPSFLREGIRTEKYSKVKIIDHKVIFKGFEEFLPVFNSNSIETMVYKIPDLSEHFIYFNDDLFLIKETKPSDFFRDGNPVLRGKWSRFDADLVYKKVGSFLGKKTSKNKIGYKKAQQNIAQILGFERYLKLDHTPAAMRKSTIENYFAQKPEMLVNNIKYKLRHPTYYMIQSLANHLEIQNKTCTVKNKYQLEYFGSYKKPLIWYKFHLFLSDRNKNRLFMCLQSLDLCPQQKLNFFFDWMNAKLNA